MALPKFYRQLQNADCSKLGQEVLGPPAGVQATLELLWQGHQIPRECDHPMASRCLSLQRAPCCLEFLFRWG